MLLARPASALLALGVLALGGCGDAARDGDFVGAPIATVASEVEVGLAADGLAPLRVTLAWSREDGVGGFVAARAGDVAIDTSAPGTIAVALLEAPAADVARHDAGVVGSLALGQLIAYVDSDGDGRFGAADRIVGIDSSVLVYSDGAASAPTLGAFGPGLHRMLAAPCAGPASPRFDGPFAAAAGSLYIGTKWESGLFAVACPALRGPCDDLEGLRAVCWDDPDAKACAACPGGVWAAGSTPAQCEAWRAACVEAYAPLECATQANHCVAGDAPCDKVCGCDEVYAVCMAASGADPAVCQVKYDACLR